MEGQLPQYLQGGIQESQEGSAQEIQIIHEKASFILS